MRTRRKRLHRHDSRRSRRFRSDRQPGRLRDVWHTRRNVPTIPARRERSLLSFERLTTTVRLDRECGDVTIFEYSDAVPVSRRVSFVRRPEIVVRDQRYPR
ncbi:hypothetical protein D8S78_03150 [Natrialba swarupiae]|nr:hypothetical protein [Natrialba swarupiae]